MLHFEGTSRVTAAFLYTFFMSIGAGLAFDGRCQQHADRIVPAFTDWPFGVNCNHLKDIWKSGTESRKDDDFKCLITHNGQNRSEGIFELSNLTDNNIYEVKLVINRVSCIKGNVVIKLERFPETCQEASRRFLRFKNSTVGDRVVLDCTTFAGGPLIIPEGANKDSFTTKWITGCDPGSRYRYVRAWANENPPNETYGMSLKMGYVDTCDTTTFTCSVKYKNRTLYAGTYSQCLKTRVPDINPVVFCTEERTGFNCTSAMAFGATKPENIRIEWKKNGVTLCENRVFEENITVDTRFSCMAHDRSKNESIKCMSNLKCNWRNGQPETKDIDFLFHISDIERKDYDSNYTIVFSVKDSNGIWKISTKHLTLENNMFFVIAPIIVIGSVVGCIIGMLVLGFVLYPQRIYVFVWYRNVFKNFDKDNKNYVAYLSYYLNDGVEPEDMEATEKIVTTIRKMMNGLQRLYYDEQTRGVSEDIYSVLSKCHRVVIVLTKDYLDEKRNESEAKKTLLGLLNSKLSLIFVSTPGVEKYLKGAKNDVLLQAVFMAMINKNNSYIKWKPDMSEEIFKRHIEHALPKLPKRNAKSSFPSYGRIEMESIASQTTASTSTNFTDAQI